MRPFSIPRFLLSLSCARALNITAVPGLAYFPSAVGADDAREFAQWAASHADIFRAVDHARASEETRLPWAARASVQFGSLYNYTSNTVHEGAPPLPAELHGIRAAVALAAGVQPDHFNQCIVNRYMPGQSILPHADHPSFGGIIACASFGAGGPAIITFAREDCRQQLAAADRSIYVMRGAARSAWSHSLEPVARLRYSVTFRRRA